MAFNLVKSLCRRENGRPDQTSTWFVVQKLDQLYIQEWWFDHSLIPSLVAVLKILAIRHAAVRMCILSKLQKWETDEDSKSVVFLARSLARDLPDLNLDFLLDMTDEIMMFSN